MAQEAVEKLPDRFDVLLADGTIYSGDGSEPFDGSIGIREQKIYVLKKDHAASNSSLQIPSDMRVDCSGLVICPGFIDLHTHSDDPVLDRNTRAGVNYLLQGCTTMVTGNCGFGPVDTDKYLKKISDDGSGTNIAHLIPQGSLRSEVIGKGDRTPSAEELQQMKALADKAMKDGAFGMTTGLIYIPGTLTKTEELIEIARVVAQHGGLYASHIRNEGSELVASIDEAIRIGSEAGCRVHVSHFKASGRDNWGTLRLAIERIEQARSKGAVVTADQYPYTASSTSLEATLLPTWSREGGRDELQKRLTNPEQLAKIRTDVEEALAKASRIQLASCSWNRSWIGKSLEELATAQNRPAVEVVLEIEKNGGASVINFGMNEDDMRLAMPLPWVATASDGGSKIPTSSMPHPRSFGTFPRKIGHYAIEQNVLSLSAAIRSSSGLPAEILGMTDRGLLKNGYWADVVVFDPKTFRDRATYESPYLTPSGIRHVLVNGTFAVFEGQATGTLSGKALRKTSAGGESVKKED
ncbi:MAG: D-aminoacylase [Planctomycetaceae bacterium]|nr:D-aminoacylase [Planctomycetaceae bacterium]